MDGRISNFMQCASVRRYELTEGSERGLKVLDCDNGVLRFLINESKAADIMQVYHNGQNVSFVSKNGFTSRETAFLNRFEGGMLYTCGLDSIGAREGYAQHGTLHQIPARITCASCDENGICILAEIKDSALFGKNLVLKRRIYSAIGSEKLEISDTLENHAYENAEYCMLYHINVGYPMLDGGAYLEGDVKNVSPHTPWAEANCAKHLAMSAPQNSCEEMCYFLDIGTPKMSLINEKLGKKFTVEWSKDTLPCFLEWKSMCSGDYALGLEPCTTRANHTFQYSVLKPDDSVTMHVTLSVEKL